MRLQLVAVGGRAVGGDVDDQEHVVASQLRVLEGLRGDGGGLLAGVGDGQHPQADAVLGGHGVHGLLGLGGIQDPELIGDVLGQGGRRRRKGPGRARRAGRGLRGGGEGKGCGAGRRRSRCGAGREPQEPQGGRRRDAGEGHLVPRTGEWGLLVLHRGHRPRRVRV